MSDLISRQEIIERCNIVIEKGIADKDGMHNVSIEEIKEFVENIPSAQKKGHWVHDNTGVTFCSECGKYAYEDESYRMVWHPNFCPHCGADMRGENNGKDKNQI